MLNQATRAPQNASPALEFTHSAIAHESKRASLKNQKIRKSENQKIRKSENQKIRKAEGQKVRRLEG
jgi:hypothetical protein